jgi:hypothetical protein
MEFKLYDIQMVDNTLCYDNVDNYDFFRFNVLFIDDANELSVVLTILKK